MSEIKIKLVSGQSSEKPKERSLQSYLWGNRKTPSRAHLVKKFTEALYNDFEQFGPEAIEACRTFHPEVYLRVIAGLVPKEIKVSQEETMSNDELESALSRLLASDLAKVIEGREGGPLPDSTRETETESAE